MWHETYHPLGGENLKDILTGLSEKEKAIVNEQVAAATAARIRNYRVTIVEPSEYDDGQYFDVENGIVIGSQDLGRK